MSRGQGERESSTSERPDPWDVAITLLGRRALTTQEVRQRLARRGYATNQIQDVIAKLTGAQYVDDAAYARTWARTRAHRHSVGPARLRQELRSKGISDTDIADAVREAFSEQDARELARAAAVRKLKTLQGLAPAIARRRLGAFLTRQGFAGDLVLELCRKHFRTIEASEDF